MIGEKVSDMIKATWPVNTQKDTADGRKDKKKEQSRTDL